MKKAVLTVIGSDRVGIIASVSKIFAESNVNILDISQTTMQEIFTMIMLVDVTNCNVPFREISEKMKTLGDELNLNIQLRDVDIFNSMHQI